MKVVESTEPKTFAERLAHLCEHFTINLPSMAEYIGLQADTLQQYLHGDKAPCEMDLHRLCKFFNIPRPILIGEQPFFTQDWGKLNGIPLFTIAQVAQFVADKTPIPKISKRTTTSRTTLTADTFAISGTILQAYHSGLYEQTGRFFIQPSKRIVSMMPYLFYDFTRPGLIIYLVTMENNQMRLYEADDGGPGMAFNTQQYRFFGGLQQVLFC